MALFVPSTYPRHCDVWGFSVLGFLALPECLTLQVAPDSFCIFPALVLGPAISPIIPGSLLENDFRNEYLGGKCAHFYCSIISSRLSQLTEQKYICVYPYTCKYFFMQKTIPMLS